MRWQTDGIASSRKMLLAMTVVILFMVMGMFDEAKAERAVRFFELQKHTKGQFSGKPFILLPWEKQIVRDVYGTLNERGIRQIKTAWIEVPKKNGKSELAAAAGLYHTFADGEMNGEVYGCAADRQQASIVFDVAVDMLDQCMTLQKRTKLQISHKRITDRKSGTFYQVLSAEAYTKHGFNVSACIFDEPHAQPNRDLVDVMTFGAGDARLQPIWWFITTAGNDPDRVSVAWEMHERALSILSGDIIDPTWYPVIYGYEGDDIYNEDNWKIANPSLGTTITIESVREQAAKAKEKPADERLFRWLRLNQWITTKLTTWLPLSLWDRTIGKWSRADLLGKDCYIGMDLSSTTDMTAVCVLFPPQGDQLDWRCFWHIWIPQENMIERVRNDKVPYDQWVKRGHVTATPGNVVDYTEVEKTILEINKFYKVIELPSDRAFAAMLLQRLGQAGITCVDIPQTFKMMTGPMGLVEMLLKKAAGRGITTENTENTEKSESEEEIQKIVEATGMDAYWLKAGLTHENNLAARWAFGNASIAKNGNEEIKLVKEHRGKSVDRTKRIDPIVALANAMARAQFYKGSLSVYESRGIRTL